MSRRHPAGRPMNRPRRHAGFGMLEALVTLVVVAVGLLGLAGLQTTLTREADTSRQRGEATRLAQQRIEIIRSFQPIDHTAGPHGRRQFGWNDLPADGSDTVDTGTNTVYTRHWSLGGTAADAFRPVSVAVSWTDRSGTPHLVALHSVIAKAEPAFSGGLAFAPPIGGPAQIELPKHRPLNIPFPAVRLNDDEVAYELDSRAGSEHTIVLGTQAESAIRSCANRSIEQIRTEGSGSGCHTLTGYLLAGHVSLRADGQGDAARIPPWPSGISLAQLIGLTDDPGAKCHLGTVIPSDDEATGIIGHRPYLCLLPVAEPGNPWSGTIYLAGLADAEVLVCRYQFKSISVTDNERNQQPYHEVRMSLDNQNYLIAAAPPGACPGLIGEQDAPLADLVQHQDCTAAGTDTEIQCPAA